MHSYLKPFQQAFKAAANPDQAPAMARYMKDQFDYLGIKSPLRHDITAELIREHGRPETGELSGILKNLWALPYREYQYLGMDLLRRCDRKLTSDHIPLLEDLICMKSWWDTVDGLAAWSVGSVFKREPERREPALGRWRSGDNLWLRRTALLFQLKYKKDTDQDLLFEIIEENLGSREFFINKAIGWTLREYSKVAPEAVRRFVEKTDLAPLSRREALKWLDRSSRN